MKFIFIFAILLVAVYAIIFILPSHVENLALVPAKAFAEPWRFVTYPFTHLDLGHLLKNIASLVLASALFFELKTRTSTFSYTYLLAGFFAVLPLWFALQFTALGASVAVYSSFGLIALETKKYKINSFFILALFMIASFIEVFVFQNSSVAFIQALSHFSGLFFGAGSFYAFEKIHSLQEQKKSFLLRETIEK